MPPVKSLHADRDRILQNIAKQAAQQAAEARRRCAGMMRRKEMLSEMLRDAEWVPRKLNHLAGRMLTASERKGHQQELRAMEAAGLIDLCTIWVRLTAAGREHVDG